MSAKKNLSIAILEASKTDDINNIEEWNRFLNKTKKFIEVTTNDYPEYTQSFLQLIEEVYNVIDTLKLKGE